MSDRELFSTGSVSSSPRPHVVARIHTVLNGALRDAVLDGLLDVNPAARARRPQRDPRQQVVNDELRAWTVEQAAHFFDEVDDHPQRALWHLAVGTGARRGELLGLRWSEVDLDARVVRITRSLSRVDGVTRLLGTKTLRLRTLSIGPDVADAPGRVTNEFRRLVTVLELPRIRLHDLRHTHASLLIAQGAPMKLVSERLGHAKIAMTMDTYAHLLPAMDGEATARFDESLRAASAKQGCGSE